MLIKIQTLINNTNFIITAISITINIFIGIIWIKNTISYFLNTRYLKKLLGFKNEEIVVTQAIFEPSMISGITHNMITYECAISLVNITTILKMCNFKYRIYEEPSVQYDEINIDGPTCNKKVNAYITTLFPNFKFVTPLSEQNKFNEYPINKQFIEYSQNEMGFKIYDDSGKILHYFEIDSRYKDIIFIIKLTSQDFNYKFKKMYLLCLQATIKEVYMRLIF